jgi:hypothetical protein
VPRRATLSSAVTAALLAALYFGCTQDFGQFEPDGSAGASGPTSGIGASGANGVGAGPGTGGEGAGPPGDCTTDGECADANVCNTDACENGSCVYTKLADGPQPGGTDLPNDCHDPICSNGVAGNAPDDTEDANDNNDCTTDSCANGVKVNMPVASGAPCAAGTCNASGQCVGCNLPSDCGAETFCQAWACDNEVCMSNPTANDTPLPSNQQAPGDCQELACDGAGSTKSVTDNGDVPGGDGNQCTAEVCVGGTPQHPPQAPGTPCDGDGVCNGSGQCVECVEDDDCDGAEVCVNNMCMCTPITCAQAGLTCGMTSDGCGNTLNCNDGQQNGTETDIDCGGTGTCPVDCGPGKKCNTGSNCTTNTCADGVCCNNSCTLACRACNLPATLGTCTFLPLYQDDNAPMCSGTMTCDGAGTCKKDNGQTCAAGSECASGKCMGAPLVCVP